MWTNQTASKNPEKHILCDINNSERREALIMKGLFKRALTTAVYSTLIGTSTERNIKGIWGNASFPEAKYFVCHKTSEALISEHALWISAKKTQQYKASPTQTDLAKRVFFPERISGLDFQGNTNVSKNNIT